MVPTDWMMSLAAPGIGLLADATVLVSIALVAVLLLRGPWRRGFGPRNVLLLWIGVPVTLLALLLPAPVVHVDAGEGSAIAGGGASQVERTASLFVARAPSSSISLPERAVANESEQAVGPTGSTGVSGIPLSVWLFGIWSLGAAATAAWLMLGQWRLHRMLGTLDRRPDGSFSSSCRGIGPVLIGALRPKIILPADFDQRYSRTQQRLILAHERCHRQRGDVQQTLLACLLRCAFWFNPLVHMAWSRFRFDQELACDATVLRRHPALRRTYAETMLLAQVRSPDVPVACTWLSGAPLKQRITILYSPPVGRARVAFGTLLALAATSVAAIGSWSAQEPDRYYAEVALPRLQLDLAAVEPMVPDGIDRFEPRRSVAPRVVPLPEPQVSFEPPDVPAPDVQMPNPAETVARVERVAATPAAEQGVGANGAGDGSQAVAQPLAASGSDSAPPAHPAALEPETLEVEHARLVEALRPDFPETRYNPMLLSYPGMPDSELPDDDWELEGELWVLLLRATLDEAGRPVEVVIDDTNVEDGRMIRRYERLAIDSVRDWRFEPARIGGEAVASQVQLPFYFDTRKFVWPLDYSEIGPRRISSSNTSSGWVDRALRRPTNR